MLDGENPSKILPGKRKTKSEVLCSKCYTANKILAWELSSAQDNLFLYVLVLRGFCVVSTYSGAQTTKST